MELLPKNKKYISKEKDFYNKYLLISVIMLY